ncbi:sugar transferase [Turicibacter sanguinis]|uniref:sugar transferase n=1 Tax=Turicibacter sanguinis TaxID=154288 RepID=UPI0018A90922|nr:sugar transferase [Turicibacter sanguinis]
MQFYIESENITKNNSRVYNFIKRVIDIFLSIIGLIVGTPLVMFFAILIYLESPGNVIFKQERLGKDGKVFVLYKLRSMKLDAEKDGQKWADKNDSRVLKIGKFIRKTRIDEIPQLVNIFKNDMSIVGPRPEIPKLAHEFEDIYPGFSNRLVIKPGLTGLAQVNGGYDMNPGEKLKKDLEYIENQSLLLDLHIIFKTISVVFTGNGAR